MKNKIIKFLKPFNKLLIYIYEIESLISRKWVSCAHKRLFSATRSCWSSPEFFDHHIDLFYKWLNTRESFWVERGVYGSLALKRGGTLLELACGDGFNARNFYSGLVNKVVACDFDKTAISLAMKKNSAPNISFVLADIRTDMPKGIYDNITWDAAIEHFTQDEILSLMKTIKSRLSPNGILSGYTIVEGDHGKAIPQHEYEFKSMSDLERFLKPFFNHVRVFETIHPQRHNLYFWASDDVIPFSDNWEHSIST